MPCRTMDSDRRARGDAARESPASMVMSLAWWATSRNTEVGSPAKNGTRRNSGSTNVGSSCPVKGSDARDRGAATAAMRLGRRCTAWSRRWRRNKSLSRSSVLSYDSSSCSDSCLSSRCASRSSFSSSFTRVACNTVRSLARAKSSAVPSREYMNSGASSDGAGRSVMDAGGTGWYDALTTAAEPDGTPTSDDRDTRGVGLQATSGTARRPGCSLSRGFRGISGRRSVGVAMEGVPATARVVGTTDKQH